MEKCDPAKNVALMHLGEEAIICGLSSNEICLKLMEMGCIPGARIKAEGKAPLGDPIRIRVDNEYSLSLRKAEAANIMVK